MQNPFPLLSQTGYRPRLSLARCDARMSRNDRASAYGSGEKLVCELQRLDQDVHLAFGIVHPEGRPAGRTDTQMIHQRPRAVMPRARRDPLLVEDGRDVVRMRRAVCNII